MIQQFDGILSTWLDYGQARLTGCMAHHTLAQILVLAACFVLGGMIELSILSAR